ncbi:MAG TPA: ATPase, T2SS/T4P/T4SS family, partial [Steroidobacteraceae bacterium]|nr:ATPase, T2SS/T4P/T4SS family [Steroidobacteraceae bacterium]
MQVEGANGPDSQPRFGAGKIRIGRDGDCDLKLSGWRVAGRHAELFVSNDQGFLRDLGSSGGTLVNGKPVTTYGPLTATDKIRIGAHSFTAAWVGESAKSSPPPAPAVNGSAPARSAAAAVAPAEPLARPAVTDESFVWRRLLHDRLLEAFDVRRVDVHRMADGELRSRAEQLIAELIERMPEIPASIDRSVLIATVRDEAIGLGLLEPLLADASITEIMVNRSDEVFIERAGVLERYPLAFTSDRAVTGIIERIVAPIGRRIDESSPMVDARLKDGSRVNAVIKPLALRGSCITIRRFPSKPLTLEGL